MSDSDDSEKEDTWSYEKITRELAIQGHDDVVAIGNQFGWHCSGVIVAPKAVLTARHCLPATKIMIGDDFRKSGQVFEVNEKHLPPERNLDVVLLEVKTKTPVRPRQLRGPGEMLPPFGMVRIYGFGNTERTGRYGAGKRHYVDLVVNGWGCDGQRIERSGCLPDHEMVMPGSSGGDTCDGDSGGPAYEVLINPATEKPELRLIGITSRPVADARVRCGNGGIYQRVDTLSAWITERLNDIKNRDKNLGRH